MPRSAPVRASACRHPGNGIRRLKGDTEPRIQTRMSTVLLRPRVNGDARTNAVAARLEATVRTRGDACEFHDASPDRMRVSCPDRTLVVTRRDGPDGVDRWSVTLRSDGETVGKFGLFDSRDDVVDTVETLLDGGVRYTVCCDG